MEYHRKSSCHYINVSVSQSFIFCLCDVHFSKGKRQSFSPYPWVSRFSSSVNTAAGSIPSQFHLEALFAFLHAKISLPLWRLGRALTYVCQSIGWALQNKCIIYSYHWCTFAIKLKSVNIISIIIDRSHLFFLSFFHQVFVNHFNSFYW